MQQYYKKVICLERPKKSWLLSEAGQATLPAPWQEEEEEEEEEEEGLHTLET